MSSDVFSPRGDRAAFIDGRGPNYRDHGKIDPKIGGSGIPQVAGIAGTDQNRLAQNPSSDTGGI